MYVQSLVAIRAALQTRAAAESEHESFDLRTVMQHPARSNRTHLPVTVQNIRQSQAIGQSHRPLPDHPFNIRIRTYFSLESLPDEACRFSDCRILRLRRTFTAEYGHQPPPQPRHCPFLPLLDMVLQLFGMSP